MAINHHEVFEVDCRIEHVKPALVLEKLGVLDAETRGRLGARVDSFASECVKVLSPRGVYRLFNPAICTLPPEYTEPAIKLVGTLMVLKGQDIYVKMSNAVQCVIGMVALGSKDAQRALRRRLCQSAEDEALVDACLTVITETASDSLNRAVITTEMNEGCHADGLIRLRDKDFSTESLSSAVFYLQAEKRLGVTVEESLLAPPYSVVSLLGFYDRAKRKRRACARCRFRKTCSIRAVGMNCHGRRGHFASATADR
jgi:hypothetical protein